MLDEALGLAPEMVQGRRRAAAATHTDNGKEEEETDEKRGMEGEKIDDCVHREECVCGK